MHKPVLPGREPVCPTEDDCAVCPFAPMGLCGNADGAELFGPMREMRVPRRRILMAQGQPGERAIIIREGYIRQFRMLNDGRRQVVGFLGPGDTLGLMPPEIDVSCTAQAITDLRYCYIDRAHLEALIVRDPRAASRVLTLAGHEITALHHHVTLLGRARAEERIASFILMLEHLNTHWNGQAQRVVSLPMPRADVADYLGLTNETISRVCSELKGAGIIEYDRPTEILIQDRIRLMEMCGHDREPEWRKRGFGL